jgi:hypothetical protein
MNTEKAVARLSEVIRRKPLALATERSYCAWLRRYCDNLKGLPAHLSSEQKLVRFLNALAQKNVAASTQNQAFSAVIPLRVPVSSSVLLNPKATPGANTRTLRPDK